MAILETRTATGMSWVKESVALFKANPQKWMLLSLAYITLFMMLPSLTKISLVAIATVILWPVFTAFAIMLFRSEELGKKETVQQVINQVKPSMKKLVSLGFLALVYVTLSSLLLSGDMKEMLPMLQQQSEKMTEAEYAQFMQNFLPFFAKLMLLLTPLFIATWFSPMLIAINQYSIGKAIKSSIAGVLQYTVALTISTLVLTAFVLAGMMLIGLVLGIAGLAGALTNFLFFGVLLTAVALFFAFQYVTYRDVFRAAPVIQS